MAKKKAAPEMHKRVGIWIRVSTEDQARGESPKHHEARARAYAESKSWQVIELYNLAGVSGKTVVNHPECRRMLKDIERGHISGLIFSKLARLGRNTKELLEFSEFFQEHEADLVSLQESIDTSTPAGRFFYTMVSAMAHWEREEIADRVSASIPIRAKLGKPIGGAAPFGYQWLDRKLVPNPTEAPVRKLVHELFKEHRRKKRVASVLNDMGYRSRGGKLFHDATIARMLEDPTAKGLHRANYTTPRDNGKGWKLKPESDWVYTPCEPVVTAELWDECAQILADQTAKRKPKSRKAVQLFGGLTWCACGEKMYVPSNTPKYVCQKCRNKLPATDLEAVFIHKLKEYFLDPEEVNNYLTGAGEALAEKQRLLASFMEERADLKGEMDQVYKLYIAGKITEDGFGERYKPLEVRWAQMNEAWPKLEAEVDFLKVNEWSRDAIVSEAKTLADHWPDLDWDTKREIVEDVVQEIVIGDAEVTFELYYLPEMMQKHLKQEETSHGPDDDPPPSKHNKSNLIKSKASAFSKDVAKGSQIPFVL